MGDRAVARADWYAARVRANRERRVADALAARGVACYVPTYRERAKWSDRVKTVERILFPGYVFLQTDIHPGAYLQVPGIVAMLPNNHTPQEIDTQDLDAIRALTTRCENARPADYAPGAPVTIKRGAFAGQRGVVQRTKAGGVRLIVNLDVLQRGVSVELDAADVETSEAACT